MSNSDLLKRLLATTPLNLVVRPCVDGHVRISEGQGGVRFPNSRDLSDLIYYPHANMEIALDAIDNMLNGIDHISLLETFSTLSSGKDDGDVALKHFFPSWDEGLSEDN